MNVSKGEIIIHPEYAKIGTYPNDIAVIELEHDLKIGPKIGNVEIVDKKYVARR